MNQLKTMLCAVALLLAMPQLSMAVTIEMVNILDGSFEMGSYDGGDNAVPVHKVQISAFKMGKYEVDQKTWVAVMGDNPSKFQGKYKPVEQVSWDDVQTFIRKLNSQTGRHYRLPTEAEWEYAARAGSTTSWSWGDNESDASDYEWYRNNSERSTHVKGSKRSNAWGLHDMHGNVWEWVQDCYIDAYYNAPTDGSAREERECGKRVLRGGSWGSILTSSRSAIRASSAPTYVSDFLGFRLAQD